MVSGTKIHDNFILCACALALHSLSVSVSLKG